MDKHSLIAGFKRKPTPVEVDGQTLYVRVMTGLERAGFFESLPAEETAVDYLSRERLLARCLCDEQGKRIFGDDDFREVGELPNDVLAKLDKAASDVNGLSAKAQAELKNG